jgi:hypothetical protein
MINNQNNINFTIHRKQNMQSRITAIDNSLREDMWWLDIIYDAEAK